MGHRIGSGDIAYSERIDRAGCLRCIKTTVYNATAPRDNRDSHDQASPTQERKERHERVGFHKPCQI